MEGSSSTLVGPNETGVRTDLSRVNAIALEAAKNKRKRTRFVKPETQAVIDSYQLPNQPRYYSEYDHPEDASDYEEPYTISIDPNAKLPGQYTMEKWWSKVKPFIVFWRRESTDGESSPILQQHDETWSDEDEGQSSSDEADTRRTTTRYGTTSVPIRQRPSTREQTKSIFDIFKPEQPSEFHQMSLAAQLEFRHRERERSKFRAYVGCLAAALVILSLGGFLPLVGRKKLRHETDAGIVISIVFNLAFAFVAVACMLSRRDVLGWLHRIAIYVIFMGICVADGVLVAWLVQA